MGRMQEAWLLNVSELLQIIFSNLVKPKQERNSYGLLQHFHISTPWLSRDSHEYSVRHHSGIWLCEELAWTWGVGNKTLLQARTPHDDQIQWC